MSAACEALSAALLSDPSPRAGNAPLALAKLDASFHMMIARAAHNPVLYQVMAGLEGLLETSISDSLAQLYRLPAVLRQLDGQHRRILEAVLAGRADEARVAATEHLLFVEAEIGIEEDEIRRERFRRQLRPAIDRFEADRRQLPGDRLHRRMRTVQHEGPGAAEIGDARGAAHDTTLSRGRPKAFAGS